MLLIKLSQQKYKEGMNMRNSKNENNKFMLIGLLANGIYLFTKEIEIFPDFIQEILIGIALAGMGLGLVDRKYDLSKFHQ